MILAEKSESIKKAVLKLHELTGEEKIRLQCEARERILDGLAKFHESKSERRTRRRTERRTTRRKKKYGIREKEG
ncbi:MAG: hypothetical protein V8T31_02520 [Lachnospiraceae bacterium]